MPKEFQPALSVFERYIYPDKVSKSVVSGGQEAPFYFYLGPTNTIPFVQMESGGSQKLLSWGEVVEVQPKSTVTIRNVSYMPGDLQLQSGPIPSGPPARVTVPVECDLSFAGDTDLVIRPRFPCDTRRCVRAYFCYSVDPAGTSGDPPGTGTIVRVDIDVTAYFRQHSPNPQSVLDYAYRDRFAFSDWEGNGSPIPDILPLGMQVSGNAMRLADVAFPEISIQGLEHVPTLIDSFYVLEY